LTGTATPPGRPGGVTVDAGVTVEAGVEPAPEPGDEPGDETGPPGSVPTWVDGVGDWNQRRATATTVHGPGMVEELNR
jgi:hypothetical protein